ncbi:MAG: hypothetical protein QOD06_1831 [Candidatus Binatota bacterium]|jgi:ferredoxin|nr:hypothetical protein [Candidatus Binatota bacterium]
MATVITEDCINCGACEPECPNTAIYQGGVEWDFEGEKHPALSEALFYIVPEKCTECVGFFDQEACAAVCPVDCCIPDPARPESEAALLERAKKLHPDVEFAPDFPSRFRKPEETPAGPAAGGNGHEPGAPAVATAPVAAAPAARPPLKAGRIERPIAPPPKPLRAKSFPQELGEDFDVLLAGAKQSKLTRAGLPVKVAIALLQPILGALPHRTKESLELAVADRRFFTNAFATALNVLLNMILYPTVLVALSYVASAGDLFSTQFKWTIFFGVAIATVESMWRLGDGFFHAKPIDQITFGPALYGIPLAILVAPIARAAAGRRRQANQVSVDGFYGGNFDDKVERDRRYGDVYRVEDWGGAYVLKMEFPRVLPPTGLRYELGLSEEMPDYDYDLMLADHTLVVRGRVTDDRVKRLTAVAPSFPPEFTRQIELEGAVRGFKHRYRDKILEVVLPKRV